MHSNINYIWRKFDIVKCMSQTMMWKIFLLKDNYLALNIYVSKKFSLKKLVKKKN